MDTYGHPIPGANRQAVNGLPCIGEIAKPITTHLKFLADSLAHWLKSIGVFNGHGENRQLKLFPSDVAPPEDDSNVAQVILNKIRLERTRQSRNRLIENIRLSCRLYRFVTNLG